MVAEAKVNIMDVNSIPPSSGVYEFSCVVDRFNYADYLLSLQNKASGGFLAGGQAISLYHA